MIRNKNPRGDAISTKSKASHLPTVLREEQALEQERIPLAENFVYGTVGNRLRGPGREDASVYNELNQLLASRTEDFRYDANGSLTFRAGFADDDDYGQQSWSYEYDLENRLAKAVKVGEHGNRVVSFKYDPFGRRIEKKVEEIVDGIAEVRTTAYVYDNEDIILEISGNSTSRYVHGPGIDEPLAVEQNGMVYYYHADGLGSTVSLTDQGGRVAQSYEYDSFGNMRQYGGAVKQPFGYTGREWDKELGLYYYRARYYDPKGGRFISKDPIGFAGGDVNLYRYVQNNPVLRTDPTGKIDPLIGGAIFLAGAHVFHLGDVFSKPNGNMWGDFKEQDGKCSLGPIVGPVGDACFPENCKKHDECYAENQCTASSWLSSALGGTKSCNQCNNNFFQ